MGRNSKRNTKGDGSQETQMSKSDKTASKLRDIGKGTC